MDQYRTFNQQTKAASPVSMKGVLLMALSFSFLLSACTGIPDGLTAVSGFEIDRYLGTWYEIARLDHRFERGLNNVSATYTLREGGGITVVNRGWDARTSQWRQANGKAFFLGDSSTGSLKVSFFGPFYGGYHILALDPENYSWVIVCGPSRKYFWILARQPELSGELLQQCIGIGRDSGFAVSELIMVTHDRIGMKKNDAQLPPPATTK